MKSASLFFLLVACNATTTYPDGGTTLVCEQHDASAFTAPAQGAPRLVKNACTPAEIQAFVNACFSAKATDATCTAWSMIDAGDGCAACVAPSLQGAKDGGVLSGWGPFDCTSLSAPCGANTGGCVDLVLGTVSKEVGQGGAAPGSCGDTWNAELACEDYACNSCAGAAFTSCVSDAVSSQCKPFVDQQTSATGPCASAAGDAAPGLARCFPQTDSDNVAFVNVFCGTGP